MPYIPILKDGFVGLMESCNKISNYLKWFKWLVTFNTGKDIIKSKNFIVQSNIPYNYTMIKEFKNRKTIFI